MSKPRYRSIFHGLVPRTLAALHAAAAEVPRPGAVGPQVLRALLVLTAAPAGCVAQPMPATARVAVRSAPAAAAMARARFVKPLRLSSVRGGWA